MSDNHTSNYAELPVELKEKLLMVASRLPSDSRAEFMDRILGRLKSLARSHQNTIIYTIAGFVVGEVIDDFLVVPFLGWKLGGDKISHFLAAAGALIGLSIDRKERSRELEVREIIQEEIKRAFNRDL